MALTNADKLALRNWLQANVYKAVRTDWYREGIKDENGKPVYGDCPFLDADGQPTTDADGNATYYGRTFVVSTRQGFDWREVVRRVWRKAVKNGYDVDPDQVEDFLRQYKDNILTWAGVTKVIGGVGIPEEAIDAEDPDA